MAGCIAVIQKRLLDGNVHSIPAWERARILEICTCAKLSKQRNYGTEILWAHCFLLKRTCVRMYYSRGIYFLQWVCVRACVCASAGGVL
jgi:hypothetical protein